MFPAGIARSKCKCPPCSPGASPAYIGISGDPTLNRLMALGDISKLGCSTLPLKSGGKLSLAWNRWSQQGASEAGSGWGGYGAVFSFLPRINTYQSQSRRVYSDEGSIDFNAQGVAVGDIPNWASLGTTYFTEAEPKSGTYYEYFGNTGAVGFGLLNRRYDLNGNQLLYKYDTSPELVTISGDIAGSVAPYFFYATGIGFSQIYLADLVTPQNSRSIYFEYDINGFMVKMVNPQGCVSQMQANPALIGSNVFYDVLLEVDPEGYTTYFGYDFSIPNVDIEHIVEPEGRITYYRYGLLSPSITTKGQIGRIPTYYFYGQNITGAAPYITGMTDALGNTSYYFYDTNVYAIQKQFNANGNLTYYTYADSGPIMYAMTSKTSALNGATTYYGYASSDYDLVKLVEPRNVSGTFQVATYFTYDTRRNRTSIIDPLGNATLYGMDSLGRVAALRDARGNVSYFNYSASTGGLMSSVDPVGNVSYYAYDSFLNTTAKVSQRWQEQNNFALFTTYYRYDQLDRVTRMTDPLANVTYFDWTSRGDLLDTVDPQKTTESFTYNGLRLMTQRTVTDVAGHQLDLKKHGYDIYRNRIQTLDALGRTTYFGYDSIDRLTTIQDALANTTYFGYDSVNNLNCLTDPRGNSTYHFFDGLSRRTAIRDPLGKVSYFTYDLADNVTQSVDARSNPSLVMYDQFNRVQATLDTLGNASYFFYDQVGNFTALLDARVNPTYYFYEGRNLRNVSRDALGNISYYGYDAMGNLSKRRDARQNATYYFYDTLDRLQSRRDALANAAYFFYDSLGNVTVARDENGNAAYFFYDGLSRTTARRDALGNPTYYFFDAVGNTTLRRDARGNSTYFFYDADDRMSAMRDATGNAAYYAYDAADNLTISDDRRGNSTYFFYDALNRLSETRKAEFVSVQKAYDETGNLVLIRPTDDTAGGGYGSQPYGTTFYGGWNPGDTYFIYDALNRVSGQRDSLGNVTYYFYDAVGNGLGSLNPLLHATYFGYDSLNRLQRMQDSLGGVTYFEFDAVSNRTKVLDPDLHAVMFRYDTLNRTNAVRSADGGSTYFFYDRASNRLRDINPLGQVTYYGYDAVNRLTLVNDPLWRTIYFQYDPVGNISLMMNAEKSTATNTYDPLNRLSQTTYAASGADILFGIRTSPYYVYDQVGNMVQMGDLWGLHRMGFDGINRATRHVYPKGQIVYFEYGLRSTLTTIAYPGTAGRSGRAYDRLLRQMNVQSPSGATAYFAYDAASNQTQRYLGNSCKVDITYDAAERIKNWRASNQNLASLSYFDYTRDLKGLIVKAVREANYTVYYTYDPNDRLASEIWAKTGSTPSEVYGYRYAYDLAGNRIKARINGANTYYFYDQANQLKVTGTNSKYASPTYYIYDKNGSVTNIVPNPGAATYFAYNTAGLVARIKWADASSSYFYYDGQLRRYGAVLNGTATYFLWEGPNLLQELNVDGTTKEEHTNTQVSFPGIGQLVETNRPGQSQPKLYPIMDPRGSITKWMQSDGSTVFASREYDAFGTIIPNSASGNWPGRFGYQGQRWQEIFSANGSQRMLISPTRLYDSNTGHFLQKDQILQNKGPQPFLYVSNNPLAAVDPTGLVSKETIAIMDEIAFLEKRNEDLLNPVKNPLTWLGFNSLTGGREVYENMLRIHELKTGRSRECSKQIFAEFKRSPAFGVAEVLYTVLPTAGPLINLLNTPYRIITGVDPLTGRELTTKERVKEAALVVTMIAGGWALGELAASVDAVAFGTEGSAFGYDLGSTWMQRRTPNTTVEMEISGSGPVPGVLEVSYRTKSTASFEQWATSPRIGKERSNFVYDPELRRMAVGKPAQDVGISGSPHELLARSLGADENIVAGGQVGTIQGDTLVLSKQSGHYWQNWTPETESRFRAFVATKLRLKVDLE